MKSTDRSGFLPLLGGGYLTFPTDLAKLLQQQAPGAWPSGTRIRKAIEGPGDRCPAGTRGEVLASVGRDGILAYVVQWDGDKDPTFLQAHKIERMCGGRRSDVAS